MNHIFWPEGFIPGLTENFVSNEVIVAGLTTSDICPLLNIATQWPIYYANSANIRFYDDKGPELADGMSFYFETFGFPVEAQCNELITPSNGQPGRIAWHGWAGEGDTRLTVRWMYVRCGRSSGSARLTCVLRPNPCSFRVSPL